MPLPIFKLATRMPSEAVRRTVVATVIDVLGFRDAGLPTIKWVTLRTSYKGDSGILLEFTLQVVTSIAPEERAANKQMSVATQSTPQKTIPPLARSGAGELVKQRERSGSDSISL